MDEALSLSAAEVTQYFGLDALLPSGRQNTFYNMIVLIQAQLRRLAEGGEASNSSSTVSMSEQHNDSCESLLKNGNVEQGRLSMKILQDSCGINARNTLTTSQGNVACVVGNTFSDISSISAVPSGAAAVTTAAEGQAIDPRREEVALLISGGVDSSVALRLLLEQGYKVRAYYLKIWLEDELAHLNSCPWEEDLQYAQAGKYGTLFAYSFI